MTLAERDKKAHRLRDHVARSQARIESMRQIIHYEYLQRSRFSMVAEALREYGTHGSLIAGCVRDHFPAEVKDKLRANAWEITDTLDQAYVLWRQAGKTSRTFRAFMSVVNAGLGL